MTRPTVMVLQAHEGLSDGDACDRLERDLAWQAAAGVHVGYVAFHPTVLVGMRNRLVHGYDRINLDMLWTVAAEELPELIRGLEAALVGWPLPTE